MKRIIASFLYCVMMLNAVQATSIVEAMQLRGVTQCTDKEASNYNQYAPCMYIRKSPRVISTTTSTTRKTTNPFNDNPTTIYNMNAPTDARVAQLVDTSVLMSNTMTHGNGLTSYDRVSDLVDTSRLYRMMRPVEVVSVTNGVSQLVDTSILTQTVNQNLTTITINTGLTVVTPQMFALPTWFGSGFTSAQGISDVVLYGRNGQYLAINHKQNQVLFETATGQTILYAFTGADNQVVFIMGSNNPNVPNLSTNGINNHAIYIVSQSGVVVNTGAHTLMLVGATDTNNTWNQDVIIAVSFTDTTNTTWNYVVMNYNGTVLKTGTSTNNIATVRALALQNPNAQPIKPVVVPTINPIIPTTTTKTLSYKINYTLGTKDANGDKKIESARCNTNGTVEVLWIEKRLGDNSFGLGVELNNKFGNQTYKVKAGDKICCKVIDTHTNHYKKAGGCEYIK